MTGDLELPVIFMTIYYQKLRSKKSRLYKMMLKSPKKTKKYGKLCADLSVSLCYN